MVVAEQWDCPAYGPDGTTHGVLCFFADVGKRSCLSESVCHTLLTVQRRRVYQRICELAAAGDPVGEYLAGEFPGPDDLLGGTAPP